MVVDREIRKNSGLSLRRVVKQWKNGHTEAVGWWQSMAGPSSTTRWAFRCLIVTCDNESGRDIRSRNESFV